MPNYYLVKTVDEYVYSCNAFFLFSLIQRRLRLLGRDKGRRSRGEDGFWRSEEQGFSLFAFLLSPHLIFRAGKTPKSRSSLFLCSTETLDTQAIKRVHLEFVIHCKMSFFESSRIRCYKSVIFSFHWWLLNLIFSIPTFRFATIFNWTIYSNILNQL